MNKKRIFDNRNLVLIINLSSFLSILFLLYIIVIENSHKLNSKSNTENVSSIDTVSLKVKNSNEIREKLLGQLANDISYFGLNDTLDVDSSYYVVVEKIIGLDSVNIVVRKLEALDLKIKVLGPFKSGYFLSIGSYPYRDDAQKAFSFIKLLFPNCELYHLDKGSLSPWIIEDGGNFGSQIKYIDETYKIQ